MKFFEPTRITSRAGRRCRVRRGTRGQRDQRQRAADRERTRRGARRRLDRATDRRVRSSVSAPSKVSASSAAGTAPARITVGSTIDRPRKMYSPSPPAPTAAAIVAVPTPITAATRIPATIDGSASGSSTRRNSWPGVIPSAMPASTSAGSIERIPATVVRMIGSSAYSTSTLMATRAPEAADERQRQQEAEHREARDGLGDVGEPHDRRAEPRAPRRQDSDRHADRTTAATVETTTRNTCWPRSAASSAACDRQNAISLNAPRPEVPRSLRRAAPADRGRADRWTGRSVPARRARPARRQPGRRSVTPSRTPRPCRGSR